MLKKMFKEVIKEYPESEIYKHYMFYDAILDTLMFGLWVDEKYTHYMVTESDEFKDTIPLTELFKALHKRWVLPEHEYHIVFYDTFSDKLRLCVTFSTEVTCMIPVEESEFTEIDRLIANIEVSIADNVNQSFMSQTIH